MSKLLQLNVVHERNPSNRSHYQTKKDMEEYGITQITQDYEMKKLNGEALKQSKWKPTALSKSTGTGVEKLHRQSAFEIGLDKMCITDGKKKKTLQPSTSKSVQQASIASVAEVRIVSLCIGQFHNHINSKLLSYPNLIYSNLI